MPEFAPARRATPIVSAILLTCAAFAAPAHAADDLDVGNAMLRPSASTAKDLSVVVASVPDYLGSGKRQGVIGVDAELNFGNGFFASSQSGLGYRFLETPSGWSLAASIGASPSRREKDGRDDRPNRLRGMGDVNAKAQANLFLNYDGGPFHATAALHQTLASRRGTGLDLSVGYDLYADQANLVRASAGVAFVNRDLMQTFFGVTPQQAASSGNPAYAPHAGIAGESIGVSWRHAFGNHWVGTLGVGAEQLHGAAADSPLTVRRTGAVASASLGYRF